MHQLAFQVVNPKYSFLCAQRTSSLPAITPAVKSVFDVEIQPSDVESSLKLLVDDIDLPCGGRSSLEESNLKGL